MRPIRSLVLIAALLVSGLGVFASRDVEAAATNIYCDYPTQNNNYVGGYCHYSAPSGEWHAWQVNLQYSPTSPPGTWTTVAINVSDGYGWQSQGAWAYTCDSGFSYKTWRLRIKVDGGVWKYSSYVNISQYPC